MRELEELASRVRAYCEKVRQERGDVAMGCVRLEASSDFVGIVYDKPGGSSAQFETSYDPERGFSLLSPDGEIQFEPDLEQVFARFTAIIDAIPEQRRQAIDQMLAQWREQGLAGPRLRAMALSFNTHYDGTRGGELSPEELRYITQVARES